jgi:hypothetical protein
VAHLIPEDDIAALNQGGDIHATDAFKTRFEVAHPDDVAPADIDAAKQCEVVAGSHENPLHKRFHFSAANSVSPSESFWAEQRPTRHKFSHGPANAKQTYHSLKLTLALVHVDHITGRIVNANHGIV